MSNGVHFVRETVHGTLRGQCDSLMKKYKSDLVVNCTGVNARELAEDNDVYPMTGKLYGDASTSSENIRTEKHYIFPNQVMATSSSRPVSIFTPLLWSSQENKSFDFPCQYSLWCSLCVACRAKSFVSNQYAWPRRDLKRSIIRFAYAARVRAC
jgi:hypothetical protein